MTFDIQSHQIIPKDQYIAFCLDSSIVLFSILMHIVYGGLDFYISHFVRLETISNVVHV